MRTLPLHAGARGLHDDVAQLEVGGETLILTHDSMAAGTHFRANADMADVAWKLVASNLSDLAAKGAEPVGVLLSYTLGTDDKRFLEGLDEALTKFAVPILGGDTIAADGPPTFGMTAIGRATYTPVPHRAGAVVGDAIYVTGPLGRAMLGFEGQPDYLAAFNRPHPRLAEGRALAPLTHAMMDISDGLLLDCWRMAQAHNDLTFQLDRATIPVADPNRLDECVRWGEDYELLFTCAPTASLPVPATRIGTVIEAQHGLLQLDDTVLDSSIGLGYQH